jgi:hypothetical protein
MTITKTVINAFPDREVVDATAPLDIVVKPGDIAKSTPGAPRECALSWACYRSMPIDEAVIYKSTAYIITKDQIIRYKLNPSTREEIVAFDRGGGFTPGHYALVPPSPSLRFGAPRTASSKSGPKTTRKLPHRRSKNVRHYGD